MRIMTLIEFIFDSYDANTHEKGGGYVNENAR